MHTLTGCVYDYEKKSYKVLYMYHTNKMKIYNSRWGLLHVFKSSSVVIYVEQCVLMLPVSMS